MGGPESVEWQARSITGRLLRTFDKEDAALRWSENNPTIGHELVKVTTVRQVETVKRPSYAKA